MNISDLLHSGSKVLRLNKIKTHQLDSEIVLSNLLKKQRENLLINLKQNVAENVIFKFEKLISRRATREPLAYILKNKEFWSKDFFVNRNTLIPRPETELLCENIVRIFKNKSLYLLDIGTGSGCIILSILTEIKKARGIGIDISKRAIEVAKKNSNKFDLSGRVKFLNKDMDHIHGYKFDLIVSNPPYIKTTDLKSLSDDVKRFEPKIALDGGKDGLDVIKKVIYKSRTILKNLGLLALEIGYGQQHKVSQILKKQNFKEELFVKDYKNNVRCIIAKLNN
ncbi:MAG: peptide chain release factor N(5)-glutamine methyltransferase [Pelagibacteraceae bacterium]|jgi:release factor glutamine methyltransferase|nr:peptide chain release factor N(5)-glutamine methyltransferase [Pelagibacteraceae bacterium]